MVLLLILAIAFYPCIEYPASQWDGIMGFSAAGIWRGGTAFLAVILITHSVLKNKIWGHLDRRSNHSSLLLWSVALIVIMYFYALLRSGEINSLKYFINLVCPCLCYLAIIMNVKSEKTLKLSAYIIVIGTLAASILAITEFVYKNFNIFGFVFDYIEVSQLHIDVGSFYRANGTFIHANFMGFFMAATTFLILTMVEVRLIAKGALVVAFLSGVAATLSLGRMCIFATIVVLLFYFFLSSKIKWSLILIPFVFLIFNIFENSFELLFISYKQRFLDVYIDSYNRYNIWSIHFARFFEKPFGWGLGNSLLYMIRPTGIGLEVAPHSQYVVILVEGGVVGISLYLSILFAFFKDAVQRLKLRDNEKKWGSFEITFLLFIIISGITDPVFNVIGAIFFVGMAFADIQKKNYLTELNKG